MKTVETRLEDSSEATLLIEVAEPTGFRRDGRRVNTEPYTAVGSSVNVPEKPEAITKLGKTFNQVITELATMTATVKSTFAKATDSASKVTIEMGLGLTAEGQLFVAKSGTSVNFKMTMVWEKAKPNAELE